MELLKQNFKQILRKEEIIDKTTEVLKDYLDKKEFFISLIFSNTCVLEESDIINIINNIDKYSSGIFEIQVIDCPYSCYIEIANKTIKTNVSMQYCSETVRSIYIEELIFNDLYKIEIPVCIDGYSQSPDYFFEIFNQSNIAYQIAKQEISLVLKFSDNDDEQTIILPVIDYKYDEKDNQFKIVTIISQNIFKYNDNIIVSIYPISNNIMGIIGFEGNIFEINEIKNDITKITNLSKD